MFGGGFSGGPGWGGPGFGGHGWGGPGFGRTRLGGGPGFGGHGWGGPGFGGHGWGGPGFGGHGWGGPGFGGHGFGGPGFGGPRKRVVIGTAALLLDGPANAEQIVQRVSEATDGALDSPAGDRRACNWTPGGSRLRYRQRRGSHPDRTGHQCVGVEGHQQ